MTTTAITTETVTTAYYEITATKGWIIDDHVKVLNQALSRAIFAETQDARGRVTGLTLAIPTDNHSITHWGVAGAIPRNALGEPVATVELVGLRESTR